MAKPQTVQYLKHGKALCGKTFVGFVDTWNWLVDFCLNLRGDGDANGLGVVTVDRSNPDCPVICGLAQKEGDNDEGSGEPETPDKDEPGEDPDEPYEDPEDFIQDDNGISDDDGTLGDDSMDYCNSIGGFGGGGGGGGGGNAISSTCS